ncbi:MAG: class I SAM-dependent methyltransferase [Myxococcota bacterium]
MSLTRLLRHPRVVRWYPARFRTTAEQDLLPTLWGWLRDQRDPEGLAWDREHGTSTCLFDRGNYEPTPPSVVRRVLDALPGDPERFAFVDLGSGKGRVVLMAAGRPFREVVGIERRRALHRRALRNRRAYRGIVVTEPTWVNADVREAPLPDGPIALFLFNPFHASVLDSVLQRVEGQECVLLTVNPYSEPWFENRGFTELQAVRFGAEDRRWACYQR